MIKDHDYWAMKEAGQKMDHKTGFLTTHILDTARGCPAGGVKIELFALADGGRRELLASTRTNSDGRTVEPLLKPGRMSAGIYELVFHIGDYFAEGADKKPNAFIDIVPIRFGVGDDNAHYHVPLLVSPYSFSTYRGS